MTLMYNQKMDKKFGSKIGTNHHAHAVGSPHRTKSSSSLNGFTGTNLSIEIVEVRESTDKRMTLGRIILNVLTYKLYFSWRSLFMCS
jgi:hypothetical protein